MKSSSGSALLLLLLAMVALGLFIHNSRLTTSYAFELALERAAYHQHKILAKSMLNYGVAFAEQNYKQLIKVLADGPRTVTLAAVGLANIDCKGTVGYSLAGKTIVVNAHIISGKEHGNTQLSCHIEPGDLPTPHLRVSNWKIHGYG